MAKDEKPEHVKKYEDLSDRVRRVISTTELKHSEAYINAANDVLKNDAGEIDYEKLDEAENQEKFADKMADTYIKAAKDHFKIKDDKDGDPIYEDRLMQAYANVTRSELAQLVRTNKKGFTQKVFEERLKPQYMEQLEKSLTQTAMGHLKNEHKGDLIKSAGLDKYVNPEVLNLGQAVNLYSSFRQQKGVTKPMLESVPDYALTDEGKKLAEIKDTYKKTA